jgi:hypothetical protein
VFGLLLGEWVAVDGVVWVDEFVRRKGCSALLTLVAISTSSVTAWALTADIAVGEELLRFWVVELLGGLLNKLAVVVEMAEKIRCQLVVDLAGGTRIHIKRDTEALEGVFDDVVVAIYYLLSGDALFACANCDRYTVLVATAYEKDILAFEAKVADIDVGWYIHTCQVSDVYRTIGIRKGCGYKCSLKRIHMIYNLTIYDL